MRPPVFAAARSEARQLLSLFIDLFWTLVKMTERLIMQDLDQAIATMEKLRDLGVRLSIDDFGTGYSSLAALRRFPVHRLKIDRSFLQHVMTSESDTALARAMISLGQRLKLKVVAEGVETDEQIQFLKRE